MPGKRNRRRGGRGSGRRRLPPLQRMYGWFHCQDCNRHWESSYVWCVKGTFKVFFKQECLNCGEAQNPYEVDYLICPVCHEYDCACEGDRASYSKKQHRPELCWKCLKYECVCDEDRHTDRRKQHRSDLCLKCRAGYPCQLDDSGLDYLDGEPEACDCYY